MSNTAGPGYHFVVKEIVDDPATPVQHLVTKSESVALRRVEAMRRRGLRAWYDCEPRERLKREDRW